MGVCVMSFPQSHLSPFYILDLETSGVYSCLHFIFQIQKNKKKQHNPSKIWILDLETNIQSSFVSFYILDLETNIHKNLVLVRGGRNALSYNPFFFFQFYFQNQSQHTSLKKKDIVCRSPILEIKPKKTRRRRPQGVV